MVIELEPLDSIAVKIRRARVALGISQKKLAKLVGLSQSEIARIEKEPEKLNPSYATIAAIVDALSDYGAENAAMNVLSKPVKDIMHRKIVYVRPNESVKRAVELMKNNDFSQLPVLNNRMASIGTIYLKDILLKYAEGNTNIDTLLVKDVMSGTLPQVDEETEISKIKSILENFDALLVSEGNKIVGIVTTYDFLRLV